MNKPTSTTNTSQHTAQHSNKPAAPCVLIGQSVDCLTAATVLASLGQSVVVYASDFEQLLKQYAFEHELVSLCQMYRAWGRLVVADGEFDASADASLLWLFVNDEVLEGAILDGLVQSLNKSVHQALPVVLSGARTMGYFQDLAARLKRPFVFYVPFVFLMDGRAFTSMLSPHLWLVGEKTPSTLHQLTPLQHIIQAAKVQYVDSVATVEFIRMSIMAMLASRVSLMNEMSHLADAHDVDIAKVSHAMGLDWRIGGGYLQAGVGFAGRTLPSEMGHLMDSFAVADAPSTVLTAVNAVNDDQKELLFRKFWCYFDGFIDQKTVMIWGGSYKTGSGRTQNAAIHPLLKLLWSYNITTLVAAGAAADELREYYADEPLFRLVDDAYQLADVHAVFMLNRISAGVVDVHRLNHYCLPIFDANTLTADEIAALSGNYHAIGRHK